VARDDRGVHRRALFSANRGNRAKKSEIFCLIVPSVSPVQTFRYLKPHENDSNCENDLPELVAIKHLSEA
jgi:hypothetical protein